MQKIFENWKIKPANSVSDNIDVILIKLTKRYQLEPIFLGLKGKEILPAKKISTCTSEIREIISKRIKSDFYNLETVKKDVAEKLLSTLFQPPKS